MKDTITIHMSEFEFLPMLINENESSGERCQLNRAYRYACYYNGTTMYIRLNQKCSLVGDEVGEWNSNDYVEILFHFG